MKTSTLVVIGLGAAAALFLVLKLRGSASTAGASGVKASQVPTARNTQQALERAAVNVGERLANEAIDWMFSDRSSVQDGLAV